MKARLYPDWAMPNLMTIGMDYRKARGVYGGVARKANLAPKRLREIAMMGVRARRAQTTPEQRKAHASHAGKIGNAELIAASRDRLRALGLDAGTAARIDKAGHAAGRVPYYAPISGVVTEFEVKEGAMVTPGMVAMTITELGSLWVIAEVPESQAGWLRAGAAAEIRFPSLPGESVSGSVEYVYPELNMETRTVRARITLARPPAAVRPNMLASVTLGGEAGDEVVNVPRSALIRSGKEDRVVVALGEGRFVARRVKAGAESGDRVAIRDGLAAGEQVVVSGQFLIDSEASLRGTTTRMADVPAPKEGMTDGMTGGPTHRGEGKVESIDKDTITLSHGPIPSLQWGPMTMDFSLPATGVPENVEVGDTVTFDVRETGDGMFQIVGISPSAPSAAAPMKGSGKRGMTNEMRVPTK